MARILYHICPLCNVRLAPGEKYECQKENASTVKRDGYTFTFANELNPWKYWEARAEIGSKRYGGKAIITDIIRKKDGSHVPR